MKITFSAGQRVQTNGAADFFRLLSTVNPVTVEFYYQGREIAERVDVEGGFAEQFRTIEFDRVDIFSATAQTVQWETALGSEIRYDRGAATVNGSVDLNTATQNALIRPLAATGFFSDTSALSADTPLTVFTAGLNPNGAILLTASIQFASTTLAHSHVFIAKETPPTTTIDGEILLQASANSYVSAGSSLGYASLEREQFIPAGKGLFFIPSLALAGNRNENMRACRYRLL